MYERIEKDTEKALELKKKKGGGGFADDPERDGSAPGIRRHQEMWTVPVRN
jgi:hypothetical protein